jgi:hypothetical protein
MTATNHALTGAIIGLTIENPLLAVCLAFVSHYVLDALPHFRPDLTDQELLPKKGYRWYLVAEASLCFLIVLTLFLLKPHHWLLAAFCAFVAAMPDLFSIPMYLKVRKGEPWEAGWYIKFASGIQWFEKPTGLPIELVWFAGAVSIFVVLLR